MAAALAVTAAGCSSGTSEPPRARAATLDSCALLSPAEIRQVTGLALPAGTAAARTTGWSVCNWEDGRVRAGVQVQAYTGDARAAFQARRQEMTPSSGRAPEDVRIAGADAAYEVGEQGTVVVRVRDTVLQLSTVGAGFGRRDHLALVELAVQGLPS